MIHVQKLIEDMANGIKVDDNLLIFKPVFKGKIIRHTDCGNTKCLSHKRMGNFNNKIRDALVFKATESQMFAAICTRCGHKEFKIGKKVD